MAKAATTRLRMNTAKRAVQTYRKVYATADKAGRVLQTKQPSRFLHSENPSAFETEAVPYTSAFPFELIRYSYLVPPTYDVENTAYAADIAASMEQSGWTGRPLWGMFDEENGWEEHGDHLDPVIELRTGSHRWFALGLLQERGIWPANLPDGYVPVVVMRRSEVSADVWDAWADADWYGMKKLGDEGIGPMPIVQLMRAERNPKTRKRGKLHRIGDLAKKTALDAITGPLRIVSKADTILTNPGTPTVKYELVDTTAKKNKLIGTFRFMQDVNGAKQLYWKFHPLATLELRTVRENPALTDRAYRYRANRNAPEGPKVCVFCEATEDVQVGHLDGHEENDDPSNLIWNCRSCNAILSHQFKTLGLGRRTRQFNPKEYKGEGAKNLEQWALAVGTAGTHKSQGSFPFVSGINHDQARQIIHDTPPDKRSEFNREILRLRYRGREKSTPKRRYASEEVPF